MKEHIPEHDLDAIVKHALKEDLPPEAEARMKRQFLKLRQSIDRRETVAEPDGRALWAHRVCNREILAFASAIMLILGGVMHFRGYRSALADSISQVKETVEASAGVYGPTLADYGAGAAEQEQSIPLPANGKGQVNR